MMFGPAYDLSACSNLFQLGIELRRGVLVLHGFSIWSDIPAGLRGCEQINMTIMLHVAVSSNRVIFRQHSKPTL
jgi:hypothetical protein